MEGAALDRERQTPINSSFRLIVKVVGARGSKKKALTTAKGLAEGHQVVL